MTHSRLKIELKREITAMMHAAREDRDRVGASKELKDYCEGAAVALHSVIVLLDSYPEGGDKIEKICGYCKNARTEVLRDGRTVLVCELTKHIVSGRDDCDKFVQAS